MTSIPNILVILKLYKSFKKIRRKYRINLGNYFSYVFRKFRIYCARTHFKVYDLQPIEFYLGQGTNALEIIILSHINPSDLGNSECIYHQKRGRATPVLIVIKYNDKFFLCGPTGEKLNIINTKDFDFVKRICISALRQSNRNNAINFVMDCFTSLDSDLPGIVNQGLLSNHELVHGTKKR